MAARETSRFEEAVAAIPDALVAELAITGTPEECADRLAEYRSSGLDRVILYHILGPDPVRSVTLIGERLAPALAQGATESVVPRA